MIYVYFSEGESFNHVAALMYALEDISHKRAEGLDACTSGHKWKEPRKRRLSLKKSQDLLFKKHKFNDERKDEHVQSPKPKVRTVKQVDTKTFADKLEKVNPHAYWLLSTYKTVQSSEQIKVGSVTKCYHDHVNLDSDTVRNELKEEMNKIIVSQADIERIESQTKGQAKNEKWHQARKNLLTSSNFGLVCKKRTILHQSLF
ncbi:uncharacterized protein LOC132754041 [Ruditapes philippinarum]|uniref:uncharacterized protein LOC132754041 n=1 Tax=Ruditapes philippinarum TaxID=129788 RepID=UPI00295B59C1|nr:uncharacterized protein LOC132754041 [Ruditapes philippinarum]